MRKDGLEGKRMQDAITTLAEVLPVRSLTCEVLISVLEGNELSSGLKVRYVDDVVRVVSCGVCVKGG